MPLKIVRNDITKMQTEAIVNTANHQPTVGTGCDYAIYKAAGFDRLFQYRIEHIGYVRQGEVFLTPAFDLPCRCIIHVVSPRYLDGNHGEEEKLRACYRKSLELAHEQGICSISFPLIATGGFAYPKEEGFRIAVDEILSFLIHHDMLVYLVVFDEKTSRLGDHIVESLESYIDKNYVEAKREEEYFGKPDFQGSVVELGFDLEERAREEVKSAARKRRMQGKETDGSKQAGSPEEESDSEPDPKDENLDARMEHLADNFSQYLLYLIDSKGMSYPEVYKRALIDKKVFSRLKNHPDYHPKKITAMCLCIGAKLNLEQTGDLLARAGYALSPCDKTDIIFSYFIENGIYDMIELDIELEKYGLDCLIS